MQCDIYFYSFATHGLSIDRCIECKTMEIYQPVWGIYVAITTTIYLFNWHKWIHANIVALLDIQRLGYKDARTHIQCTFTILLHISSIGNIQYQIEFTQYKLWIYLKRRPNTSTTTTAKHSHHQILQIVLWWPQRNVKYKHKNATHVKHESKIIWIQAKSVMPPFRLVSAWTVERKCRRAA